MMAVLLVTMVLIIDTTTTMATTMMNGGYQIVIKIVRLEEALFLPLLLRCTVMTTGKCQLITGRISVTVLIMVRITITFILLLAIEPLLDSTITQQTIIGISCFLLGVKFIFCFVGN